MATATDSKRKLSVAQRRRLDDLAEKVDSSVRVIGWDDKYKGPVISFDHRNMIVTRDGGLFPE